MKLTNKKTYILFTSSEVKKEIIEFLLNINIKFRYSKNWVEVAPSNYLKNHLDLYLPKHLAVTKFNKK